MLLYSTTLSAGAGMGGTDTHSVIPPSVLKTCPRKQFPPKKLTIQTGMKTGMAGSGKYIQQSKTTRLKEISYF